MISVHGRVMNAHSCIQLAIYERGFPFTAQRVKRVCAVPIDFDESDLTMIIKSPKDFPMSLEGFEEELDRLLIKPNLTEGEWMVLGLFGNIIVCMFLSLVSVFLVQVLVKRFREFFVSVL